MTIKNPGGPADTQDTRLDRLVVACRCCPGGVSRRSRARRYPSDMSDAEWAVIEPWTVVLEGPPTAGMIVITAAHGGTFRETIAMSKVYAEARAEHGQSGLLDEIVSAKPKVDHTRYHSAEDLAHS